MSKFHAHDCPIASEKQARVAARSIHAWPKDSPEHLELLGDRLLEMIAYLACARFQRIKRLPKVKTKDLECDQLHYHDRFCDDTLGVAGFGPTFRMVASMRYRASPEKWPLVNFDDSPDEVLGEMMVPEHRARVEAAILASRTQSFRKARAPSRRL